jgi:hypothetical protein
MRVTEYIQTYRIFQGTSGKKLTLGTRAGMAAVDPLQAVPCSRRKWQLLSEPVIRQLVSGVAIAHAKTRRSSPSIDAPLWADRAFLPCSSATDRLGQHKKIGTAELLTLNASLPRREVRSCVQAVPVSAA